VHAAAAHAVRASNLERAGREAERRGRSVVRGEEEGGAGEEGGERHRSSPVGLRAEKPARMMMLGDAAPAGSGGLFGATGNGRAATLLEKGGGDAVALVGDRKEPGGGKAPLFEMLWDDPSSLRSVSPCPAPVQGYFAHKKNLPP